MEVEKRTNRGAEVFEFPHRPFVLEPDYADIAKRLRFISQPLLCFVTPILFMIRW